MAKPRPGVEPLTALYWGGICFVVTGGAGVILTSKIFFRHNETLYSTYDPEGKRVQYDFDFPRRKDFDNGIEISAKRINASGQWETNLFLIKGYADNKFLRINGYVPGGREQADGLIAQTCKIENKTPEGNFVTDPSCLETRFAK